VNRECGVGGGKLSGHIHEELMLILILLEWETF
jgi:hypothetical protein